MTETFRSRIVGRITKFSRQFRKGQLLSAAPFSGAILLRKCDTAKEMGYSEECDGSFKHGGACRNVFFFSHLGTPSGRENVG